MAVGLSINCIAFLLIMRQVFLQEYADIFLHVTVCVCLFTFPSSVVHLDMFAYNLISLYSNRQLNEITILFCSNKYLEVNNEKQQNLFNSIN